MKMVGFSLGTFMLLLGYLAVYWSFQLLIEADNKTGGHTDMRDLLLDTGGKKLANYYEIVCAFTLFCMILGNQIISKSDLKISCKNDSINTNNFSLRQSRVISSLSCVVRFNIYCISYLFS